MPAERKFVVLDVYESSDGKSVRLVQLNGNEVVIEREHIRQLADLLTRLPKPIYDHSLLIGRVYRRVPQ